MVISYTVLFIHFMLQKCNDTCSMKYLKSSCTLLFRISCYKNEMILLFVIHYQTLRLTESRS